MLTGPLRAKPQPRLIAAAIEDRRVVERILRHLDLLVEPSRGPPSDEFVYEPSYDDLPVVEEEDVVYQPF